MLYREAEYIKYLEAKTLGDVLVAVFGSKK